MTFAANRQLRRWFPYPKSFVTKLRLILGITRLLNLLCQMKRQATTGSARRATSRATSTTRLADGCISILRVISTTGKPNQLAERMPLNTRDILLLTQWATTHRCNLTMAAATTTRALAFNSEPSTQGVRLRITSNHRRRRERCQGQTLTDALELMHGESYSAA